MIQFFAAFFALTAFAQEPSPKQLYQEMLENGWDLGTHEKAVGPASYRMTVEVFKKSSNLGIPYEFVLVNVDGQLEHVFVASTAKAGKVTIEGEYPLSIGYEAGAKSPEKKPYPWHRSALYANSPMFWGLHIYGGFWMHSTPHYGELGGPASMGCVRLTFPAAMEVWDTMVNRVNGSARIRIYGSTFKGAEALAAHRLDAGWLKDQIERDLGDAQAVTKADYNGTGHARPNQELHYPSCGGVDCFEYFGVKAKP